MSITIKGTASSLNRFCLFRMLSRLETGKKMISRFGSAHLNSCFVASLGLLVLCVPGCGGSEGLDTMIPISGKVMYNNEPLTGGTITYLPGGSKRTRQSSERARQAIGAIQQDGSFVLTTLKAGDGAILGEYAIVIHAYEPSSGKPKTRGELEAMRSGDKPSYIIPEKYTQAETSGLHDTVDENHSGFKLIELND